jgi:hypothetical protein
MASKAFIRLMSSIWISFVLRSYTPHFDWSLLNYEMGVNENWKKNLDARDEVNWRNLNCGVDYKE